MIDTKLPLCYIALDIETTGKHFFGKDKCIAIGWAYGHPEDKIVTTGNACLDMSKPGEMRWQDFWQREGFEKSCFDSFWSNHLSVLDTLQDKERVNLFHSEKDMIRQLDDILHKMELSFDQVVIVTDTTCYDTVWLSYLLAKHGYETLLYHRDGSYNGGAIEIDSYKYGVFNVMPIYDACHWNEDGKLSNVWSIHDHHPENDAHHILSILFSSIDVVTRNQ